MKNIDQYKEISNTKYGQSGIVYESSLTTTDKIYLTQKESENMHVYVSGTLKNNSSSTQVVKMSLIGFDQGEVQISILSGEILELKNIRLREFFPLSTDSEIEVLLIRSYSTRMDLVGNIIKR